MKRPQARVVCRCAGAALTIVSAVGCGDLAEPGGTPDTDSGNVFLTGDGGFAFDVTTPIPIGGDTCATNADCPSNSACYFPIGSCGSQGQCFETVPAPCMVLQELCGCDGAPVFSGCGYPSGYASGPAEGGTDCSEEGGRPEDGGGPFESDGAPSPGTVLGPCHYNDGGVGGCPLGSLCSYPIGSCSAIPECVEAEPIHLPHPEPGLPPTIPPLPPCEATEFCGCGVIAVAGCEYPDGYASAPTTANSCFIEDGGGPDEGPPDVGPPEDTGPPDVGPKDTGTSDAVPPEDEGPPDVAVAEDTGASLGPCASNQDCTSGSCFFPIGSCDAGGECMQFSSMCDAITFTCGCGEMAQTGCSAPSGYGTAPSIGAAACNGPDE